MILIPMPTDGRQTAASRGSLPTGSIAPSLSSRSDEPTMMKLCLRVIARLEPSPRGHHLELEARCVLPDF